MLCNKNTLVNATVRPLNHKSNIISILVRVSTTEEMFNRRARLKSLRHYHPAVINKFPGASYPQSADLSTVLSSLYISSKFLSSAN